MTTTLKWGIKRTMQIQMMSERKSTGFPSPAEPYAEGALDLNELIKTHPFASYYLRVSGESMAQSGIFSGDIVLVDRSLSPQSGDIIIAQHDDELMIRRLSIHHNIISLLTESANYPPIILQISQELQCFGVVRAIIRKLKN